MFQDEHELVGGRERVEQGDDSWVRKTFVRCDLEIEQAGKWEVVAEPPEQHFEHDGKSVVALRQHHIARCACCKAFEHPVGAKVF